MKVVINRKEAGTEIVYSDVLQTSQRGDFFCLFFEIDEKPVVHKYPINSIVLVKEYSDDD